MNPIPHSWLFRSPRAEGSERGIPDPWLSRLAMREWLVMFAEGLHKSDA